MITSRARWFVTAIIGAGLLLALSLAACSSQTPQSRLLIPEGISTSEATPLPDGATIGPEVKYDISPPLRTLKGSLTDPVQREMEEEEDEEERERGQGAIEPPEVEDTVLQGEGISVAAVPEPIRSFDGATLGGFVGPLDPNGDIGLSHYVQMINYRFQIWDKNTGQSVYGPVDTSTVFQGFGAPCEFVGGVDPIVLYDHLADRWFLSYLVGSENGGGMCIAVSVSADPTDAYHRYHFPLGGAFYDYPKFGVWPDGYYMTSHLGNGQTIVVFNRVQMLAGDDEPLFHEFGVLDTNTLTPADLDGATPPPAGAPNLVAELEFDTGAFNTVNIRRVHVDWNTPANSSVSAPVPVSVAAYTPGTDVPHLGSPPNLWSLADPLMFRLVYRNFGTHEVLLATHHVRANNTSGVRWYEFRNLSTTPVVHQQGTYAPDSQSRWIPSIAMDEAGNILLGYNIVTAGTEPGIAYTGRLAGDPLGQMTQGEAVLVSGSGIYAGDRWGDYNDMVVDPTDDCTFWFTGQYLLNSAVASRIGSFRFPSCTGSTGTPTPTATQGPSPTPTPTLTPTLSPTPSATPSGALRVQLRANGPDNTMRSDFAFRVVNGGSTAQSNISVRVYFTLDGSQPASKYVLEKWWDQSGSATVSGPTLASGSTYFFTVSYGTSSLPAGSSWEYQTTIHLNDWSANFDGFNDWWHNTGTLPTTFSDWARIPAFVGSSLVWGAVP